MSVLLFCIFHATGSRCFFKAPCCLPSAGCIATLQAPDAAAIRTAITEEARRQGTEHTLREERPPAASQRRNMLLTPDMLGAVDAELLNLLEQALTGSAGNLLQQGLQGVRLSGSGDGGQGQGEEEEVSIRLARTGERLGWVSSYAGYHHHHHAVRHGAPSAGRQHQQQRASAA